VILFVALVCVVTSALLSKALTERQIEKSAKEYEEELGLTSSSPGLPTPPLPPKPRYMTLSFVLAGLLGLVLALVLSYTIAGRISRPLTGLTSAARKITSGDYGEKALIGGGREVKELGEAFNTLTEELERNEELRKNMVTDIAHELRNPLTTLRGNLELLEDHKIESDDETVGSLIKDAELLTRLVDDLRQLSLVEAGQLELEMGLIDIADTLSRVCQRLGHEATSAGISIFVETEPMLPRVSADRTRIEQVLGNLVGNSLKHTPEGGTVRVAAALRDGDIVFSVEDTGPGIEREELPYVFERFHRADRSRSRETGGAGLGLTIARGLVEAHGGRIWAESEVGRGTSIFFTLPVPVVEPGDAHHPY